MKHIFNIKIFFFIGILTITSCSSYVKLDNRITPVEKPFEYQNEYYPISIGDYRKMLSVAPYKDTSYALNGFFEHRIIEYKYEDLFFGDTLISVPVFKKERKFYKLREKEYDEIEYSYIIKTNEGIFECLEPPRNNMIVPYLFIPSHTSYDYLSFELTGFKINRGIKLETKLWEMYTLRINFHKGENIGGLYYTKIRGHVYSEFYKRPLRPNKRPFVEFVLTKIKN